MEPATIFSLSLAAVNILLTTISGIIDKGEQLKNFEQRYKRYVECLENGRASLIWWAARWEREKEEDYEAIFGKQDWARIQERKNDVTALLNNILGHLDLNPQPPEDNTTAKADSNRHRISSSLKHFFSRSKKDGSKRALTTSSANTSVSSRAVETAPTVESTETINDTEVAAWRVYVRSEAGVDVLDEQNGGVLLPEKPEFLLLMRIAGVFYANQQLDRKVDEMGKAIDRLHSFSRYCYGAMGFGKLNSDPEKAEVDQNVQIVQLQKIAGAVLRSYLPLKSEYQWKLQLRMPDDDVEDDTKVFPAFVRNGTLYFTVFSRSAKDAPFSAQELSLQHLEGELIPTNPAMPLGLAMSQVFSHSSQIVQSDDGLIIELRQSGVPILWTKSLRHLLSSIHGNDELQMVFLQERARLAYSCTLWMILLWKTNWFTNLCSCGFRSVVFSNESTNQKAKLVTRTNNAADATPRYEYVFRTQGVEQNQHPCPRKFPSSNKLYLLGILLAEIFLSEPIDLEEVNGKLTLSDTQRFSSNLEIVRQMEKIDTIGSRNPVVDAVKFCFQKATKKEWTSSQQPIKESQINTLLENVLKPLKTYLKLVEEVFRPPWSDKVLPELKKLADQDLQETEEHVPRVHVDPGPQVEGSAARESGAGR